ncbi:MAG TPA: rhomboid family intramembrane serine protease [Streptosporangiaceae bacterium]
MSTPGPVEGAGEVGGGPAAVPTCYRHPGRETYVSCVRCGRPACPDCLRSAAVGQQCVECIRAGQQGNRRPAGVFGGRPSAAATVTWALVAINIILYVVEWSRPGIANDMAMVGVGRFTAGGPLVGVATGQWYRLITSAFLPPPGAGGLGPFDIIFNMWALIIVGPVLEKTLGHLRYLTVYLASAAGGSILFYWLTTSQEALGASGAIFGLLGAWFVVSRRLGLDSRWLVTIVALNLVFDLLLRSQIAWQAHVGGLLTGGLLTAAFAYAPREHRAWLQPAAAVVLAGLMVLAVVTRTHQLHQQLGF